MMNATKAVMALICFICLTYSNCQRQAGTCLYPFRPTDSYCACCPPILAEVEAELAFSAAGRPI